MRILKGHAADVTAVRLSADGLFVLSGGRDGTMRILNLATGRGLRTIEAHGSWVAAIALSPDGRLAVSAGSENASTHGLRVWNLETGGCLYTLQPGPTYSVAISADGRFIWSGHYDALRVWETATGDCLHSLQPPIKFTNGMWVGADGRFAVAGGQDRTGTVQVWDITSNECVRTIEVHHTVVRSVSLSGDGRLALFGVPDGEVRVYEIDWDLAVRDPADWDEGARPYLTTFLSLHTPLVGAVSGWWGELPEEQVRAALTRRGAPSWREADFQRLYLQLQYAGYGWLRPAGVRAELARMAHGWLEPPPLPGS